MKQHRACRGNNSFQQPNGAGWYPQNIILVEVDWYILASYPGSYSHNFALRDSWTENVCTERFTSTHPIQSCSLRISTQVHSSIISMTSYCLGNNQERSSIFLSLFESMRDCHDLRSLMMGKVNQKSSLFCACCHHHDFYMLFKSLESCAPPSWTRALQHP